MELLSNISNRWATSDGALTFAFSGESAEASCGSVTVDVSIADGHATIQLSDAKTLMPEIGVYEVVVSNDGAETLFNIERVSARYTSKYAIVEYGRTNNDGFDDTNRYTDEVFAQAILAAEEAIERGCQRSFCKRRIDVILSDPKLNELPVCDVFNIDCEDESVKLVSYCQASGVDSETKVTIDYGTSLDSMIAMAATRLAASFIRPRATPENARGTSQDGVYVSYELPTGDDGSWTGLPFVDAVIESHRSKRTVIG